MPIIPQDISHSDFNINGEILSGAHVTKLGPGQSLPSNEANQGGGIVINAPGNGKSIYIAAVSTFSSLVLKENDDQGEVIAYVAAGNCGLALPSPLKVKENTAVYSPICTNLSIFYYIK